MRRHRRGQNQGADSSLSAELSAPLDPYAECLPSAAAEQASQRWVDLFKVISHTDHLHGVTL